MKFLIVDDSKTMRLVLRNTLSQLGYSEMEEASDGADALSKVAAAKPDIILLDWNMPNMDGITFLKTYRGQGGAALVIMVTTEAEKARVVEAIKAGVNNYVVKPFTPETLSERINQTIANKKAA